MEYLTFETLKKKILSNKFSKEEKKDWIIRYFESFADRVDNNDLSWKSMIQIMLLGGILYEIGYCILKLIFGG